ncbi:MAG: hypothetical protein ACI4ES_07385, partial [Roseburia sp.]
VMELIQLRRTPAFLLLIRKFLQTQKPLSLLRLGAFYLMELTVSRPRPYKGACGSLDTVNSHQNSINQAK